VAKFEDTKLAIAAILYMATFAVPTSATAGQVLDKKQMAFVGKVIEKLELIDGPYLYKGKNDIVARLVWKVVDADSKSGKSEDMLKLRLCDGSEIDAKAEALKGPVKRKCPKGSPPVPWYVLGSQIVPGSGQTAFANQKIAMDKLPATFKKALAGAKDGDLVGFAFKSVNGKMNLSIINRDQI
jgi:hypothetical protein